MTTIYVITVFMFIDQLTIFAKGGDGGNGVVRWRHEKYKPMAGPSGGNGGNGGDVFMRAVRDVNLLSKYTGAKDFAAEDGVQGTNNSMHGRNGEHLTIDVPVGSIVTDVTRNRVYELSKEGETIRVFKGGAGGLGNEHFKTPTNRAPEEATDGKPGEDGELEIQLSLVVDVGLIGMPNAGKSTLLNNFTNAHSKIGAYPFTTTEPHLGDLHGFIIADIPGLIEGASDGKGLGHTFLRHVTHTKTILHLVSLESEDAWERYYTIREELSGYGKELDSKEEWIIFTKKDLATKEYLDTLQKDIDKIENRVFVISVETGEGVKELKDSLVKSLRQV
jgi:GTP-binding protein